MYYAAIVLGLAGSLHCAGMCSPLMMAVTSQRPFMLTKIFYNSGRILTYGVLGAVGALLGTLFQFSQYQSALSFMLGALLVVGGFAGITGFRIPFITPLLNKATHWLKRKFGWALGRSSLGSRFLMGMINGLLPCGLTYLALTGTFILPTAKDGFFYMLAFGAGTWPVMIGLGWVFQVTALRFWLKNPRTIQVAIVVAGLLLIGRVWWTHGKPTTHLQATVEKEVVCP